MNGQGISCLIRGEMLGFRDDELKLHPEFELRVKSARVKDRDEKNRITWVYDRLLGLTPENTRR